MTPNEIARALSDLKAELSRIGRAAASLEKEEWQKGWIEARFDMVYHLLDDLKP